MSTVKRAAACLLLALLGGASAQGGTRTVYFVFKAATTLPITLQATPECMAERAAWESGTPAPEGLPGLRLLETYSFVSPLDVGALRQSVEAYAQEHLFRAGDVVMQAGGPGGQTWGREFENSKAPGVRYAVRISERVQSPEGLSVLCITVRSASRADDPYLPPSSDE